MILCQNSYYVVDAHPERFTTILSNLISQQDYYRELVRDRQRQNKRVWIYSDEVGNHNYALASGWTWLRLAQENPKQLAPDPEPSAPGEEPVVTPQRIVSTDKKALQLGGRQVALDGQPVRPTDEVNVAKKYQLIALE